MPVEEPPPAGRADARPADRVQSAEPRDAPSAFAQMRTEPPGDAHIATTVTATELAPELEGAEARAPRDDEHPVTIVQARDGEAADDGGDPRDGARVAVHQVIADTPRRQSARPVPRATRLGRRGPERVAAEPAADAPLPPPDVHIHIGRVELTAIAPPQPARREAANTRKPMSLDEYLRRRGGRES
jgi:hypothetical protein